MRMLTMDTIAILIILGLVRAMQDYEMINDTSCQLSDNKDDDKVVYLSNFKNLHAKELNPSDFF